MSSLSGAPSAGCLQFEPDSSLATSDECHPSNLLSMRTQKATEAVHAVFSDVRPIDNYQSNTMDHSLLHQTPFFSLPLDAWAMLAHFVFLFFLVVTDRLPSATVLAAFVGGVPTVLFADRATHDALQSVPRSMPQQPMILVGRGGRPRWRRLPALWDVHHDPPPIPAMASLHGILTHKDQDDDNDDYDYDNDDDDNLNYTNLSPLHPDPHPNSRSFALDTPRPLEQHALKTCPEQRRAAIRALASRMCLRVTGSMVGSRCRRQLLS